MNEYIYEMTKDMPEEETDYMMENYKKRRYKKYYNDFNEGAENVENTVDLELQHFFVVKNRVHSNFNNIFLL